MKVDYIFPALAVGASLVPAVYGVSRAARWGSGERALWAWFVMTAAANVVGMLLALRDIRTSVFALYVFPLLAIFGLEALGRLTRSNRILLSYRLVTLVYVAGWVWCMLALEKRGDFNTYVAPALGLVLTVAAAILIVKRVQTGVPSLFRDTAVLAGLATFLLFAPGAVLDPVSLVLYKGHPLLVQQLFNVRSLLEVCGSLLTAVALRWAPTTL